jgi:putative oxidoreductase
LSGVPAGLGIPLNGMTRKEVTMLGFLSRFQSEAYALLRIVAGFLFLWHGMQKLFGFPAAPPADAPGFVIFVAGPIELACGALVMLGLFVRPAAFLCSGLMACAYWMAHGTAHPLPLLNHGELAALYCFVFLFIATRGCGIWSIDALRTSASSADGREPGDPA